MLPVFEKYASPRYWIWQFGNGWPRTLKRSPVTKNRRDSTPSPRGASASLLERILAVQKPLPQQFVKALAANMAADVIVDTGAILALLDARDRWHALCSATLRQLRLPLLTTEAILTEVFHLIRRSRTEMRAVWTLLDAGVIVLATIDNSELHRIQALMSRYKDLPMDFADATLVYLGEREAITAVFTLDQNDFATYRIAGRRRFHILPVERP